MTSVTKAARYGSEDNSDGGKADKASIAEKAPSISASSFQHASGIRVRWNSAAVRVAVLVFALQYEKASSSFHLRCCLKHVHELLAAESEQNQHLLVGLGSDRIKVKQVEDEPMLAALEQATLRPVSQSPLASIDAGP